MKIAICAANTVGERLANFIVKSNHNIEFAITHAADVYEPKIYNIFQENGIECHRQLDANGAKFANLLSSHSIDLVFLLWWPQILKEHVIEQPSVGIVNLHPSLLPFNRGKHPWYWSIVEGTPAGVSLHFINADIDSGDIIAQREISKSITTTGRCLYDESIEEIVELFKTNYESIIAQTLKSRPQHDSVGTFHYARELDKHSEIKLEEEYRAADLINIMRARSFPSSPSSFFFLNGKRYYVNIIITEAGKDEE